MIEFCYETPFSLKNEEEVRSWINTVVEGENKTVHELVYVFCDDERLLELNREYLDHDTYTDILTFPYSESDGIQADIFISIPRVLENAKRYNIVVEEELRRVMIHGVLHLVGYNDHSEDEKIKMRELEESKLKMFHVEQ